MPCSNQLDGEYTAWAPLNEKTRFLHLSIDHKTELSRQCFIVMIIFGMKPMFLSCSVGICEQRAYLMHSVCVFVWFAVTPMLLINFSVAWVTTIGWQTNNPNSYCVNWCLVIAKLAVFPPVRPICTRDSKYTFICCVWFPWQHTFFLQSIIWYLSQE